MTVLLPSKLPDNAMTRSAAAKKSPKRPPAPNAAKPRKRLRRGEADARVPEILAVALTIFAEKGFAATRMDDIAAGVGVSKPILYRHFATKDDLFKALLLEDLQEPFQQAQVLITNFQGPLRLLLTGFVHMMKTTLPTKHVIDSVKVMATAPVNIKSNRTVLGDGLDLANRALADHFVRRMAMGEMRKSDPVIAARHFMAPLWQCAFRQLLLGETEWTDWEMARYLDEAFEAYCHAYEIA
ncbi:MAG: TetR/AcrR family transcriptional regulator [Alphaproteobacteria bacterium]|nr:TetR/AcrR family transcriptional regulator [Alphaproteobacteria bacterium]